MDILGYLKILWEFKEDHKLSASDKLVKCKRVIVVKTQGDVDSGLQQNQTIYHVDESLLNILLAFRMQI